jgi:hypothetical protein
MGIDQRHKALDTEKVGRNQKINMQNMAVEDFVMQKQFSQFYRLFGGSNTEGVFGGMNRGKGMSARAYAAYPARDMLSLEYRSASQ